VNPEASACPPSPARYRFDDAELPRDFQWLRSPQPQTLFSLTQRPGHLTLIGRETIGSQFEQSLVARRITALAFEASTQLDYAPSHFQQAAGLVCYYNASKFHYLYLSQDDEAGRHLRVMSALPDPQAPEAHSDIYPVGDGPLELRVKSDGRTLTFAFRPAGAATWTELAASFDASLLSDEMTLPGDPGFTGAFVGMACQDMSGQAMPAHFAWFDYRDIAAAAADTVPEPVLPAPSARTG
jgi:xylan 1,4-beta-xylosidase